jgi:hypothetical protein
MISEQREKINVNVHVNIEREIPQEDYFTLNYPLNVNKVE